MVWWFSSVFFFLGGAKDSDQPGKVRGLTCLLEPGGGWVNTYSLFNSYSKLMGILSGAPCHPNTYSLFNSYSKLMEILSGAPFSPNTYSLFNSYSKLMKILSEASFHTNTYSLFNSYSELMKILSIYIYIYI